MDILSKLRSVRVGPFAVFDFASSFGAAWFGAPLVENYISRERLLYLVVPAGVLAHSILGISTPLNKMLFSEEEEEANWFARIAVAILLARAILIPKKLI